MAAKINELRAQRAKLAGDANAAIRAAQAKAKVEGRSLTPEELAADDQAEAQIKALDDEIALEARLLERERLLGSAASPRDPVAPTVAGSGIQVGRDHAIDRPWAKGKVGLGEWAMAALNAASGRGTDPRLFAAATGMGSEDPATGGFAVPVEQATEIEAKMFESGQILSLVDARDVMGDSVTYNIIGSQTSRADGYRSGGVLGYWVDAGEEPTASMIKLERLEMKLRKVGAIGYMTDELMQDASALGGELQSAFAEELLFQVEDKIWEGSGAGCPLGFTKAPCWAAITIETGQTLANGGIVPANLSKMWARIPPRLKAGAVWCVGSEMMVELDKLALPVGTAALEPRFVSYGPDGIMRIKGRPVIEVEYASALGTVGDIVCANFSQYRLIRKAGGVQQASSIHVKFAAGEVAFRAFYRVDGQPVPRGTVAEYKGSNARTPFVGLAARS